MEELVLNIFLLPGIASQQFVYLVNNLPLVNKLKKQISNFEKAVHSVILYITSQYNINFQKERIKKKHNTF